MLLGWGLLGKEPDTQPSENVFKVPVHFEGQVYSGSEFTELAAGLKKQGVIFRYRLIEQTCKPVEGGMPDEVVCELDAKKK